MLLDFIKKHKLILVNALVLTFLVSAPIIFFPAVAGTRYQGINIAHFGSDEHYYLSRAREILDSGKLGNIFLREWKDGGDTYSSYTEQILLLPFRLLHININVVALYNVYNFIGVFVLILLIYFFVYQLSRDKLLSALCAIFVIGGYSIIYNKTLFYHDFNAYGRSPNPYISALFVFSYLNFLVKSFKSVDIKYKILSGIVFGISIYVYFYTWTFLLAFNGALCLIFVLKKDYQKARDILLISAGGLLIGSYNLLKMFLLFRSDMGKQISYFIWSSHSRAPIFSLLGTVTLGLFVYYNLKIKNDNNKLIVLAIIIAGWISLNQQILTNRTLQYGHFYWYFIVPLSIIIGLYMVWNLLPSTGLYRKIFFLVLLLTAYINTCGGQYLSFNSSYKEKISEQDYAPILQVLNKDQQRGVILVADDTYSYLFSIYTPHDFFWMGAAIMSNTPVQRIKDALFVYMFLNKQSKGGLATYINKVAPIHNRQNFYYEFYTTLEGYWSGLDYYDYERKVALDDPQIIAERKTILPELDKEYASMAFKTGGVEALLKKYGVNYIVWNKNKNPEWDLSSLSGLTEVISNQNIYLYKISYQ